MLKSRIPMIAAGLPVLVDRAVEEAADKIVESAKVRVPDRAPVGEGLIAAIHTERRGVGERAVVAGDGDHWYGHLVEYGTTHSAPKPFLVPAAEETRPVFVSLVQAALEAL